MSYEDRLKRKTDDAEKTMSTICSHVASGGSMIELCKLWDVRFGDMSNWIRADRRRSDRYTDCTKDRVEWAGEAVLMELRRIGLIDIRKMFNDDGEVKEPKDWPDDIAAVVSSVDTTFNKAGERTVKVKFWNKEKALELLGKNMSMFIDLINHSGKLSLEDLVHESRGDSAKSGDSDNEGTD